jgi:hypothetical protein
MLSGIYCRYTCWDLWGTSYERNRLVRFAITSEKNAFSNLREDLAFEKRLRTHLQADCECLDLKPVSVT